MTLMCELREQKHYLEVEVTGVWLSFKVRGEDKDTLERMEKGGIFCEKRNQKVMLASSSFKRVGLLIML